MSAEHGQERHEQAGQTPGELEALRQDKLEELRDQPETEDNSRERVEQARKDIEKHTQVAEETPKAEAQPDARPTGIPFLNQRLNYAQTLESVQRKLSPVSRSFSKVIHAPAVEKASEALENTVARPSVTAGATWTALIVGGLFYLTARRYGYDLSGSELLFSFVIGALLGILIEGLWRSFKRH